MVCIRSPSWHRRVAARREGRSSVRQGGGSPWSDNKVLYFSLQIFLPPILSVAPSQPGFGVFWLYAWERRKYHWKKTHGKFPAKVWVLFFRRDTTGAQGLAAGSSWCKRRSRASVLLMILKHLGQSRNCSAWVQKTRRGKPLKSLPYEPREKAVIPEMFNRKVRV